MSTTLSTPVSEEFTEPVIHPVVLCGGSGTRLWPVSRKSYPKQFVPLIGEDSLYQTTLKRFRGPGFAPSLVMTGEDFRFMATEQASIAGHPDARIVVEPLSRDTAPTIVTAALILSQTPDALMLVAPSDHLIEDLDTFHTAIVKGAEAARTGALVTFGVSPTRPETGFGYLRLGADIVGSAAVPLLEFREKPDLAQAQDMLADGRYLWNAGLFMFRVGDLLEAVATHAPDLTDPCRTAIDEGTEDLGFFRLGSDAYAQARAISFDYAVMEKIQGVTAVPFDCGWSDLGSWDAVGELAQQSDTGVATHGSVTTLDCADSYLHCDAEGMQLVGLGLDGIVAVAMRDAVLVANKTHIQDVKSVVATLRAQNVSQADNYPRHHRPWGWYETLCLGERFQVKRIMVKPGGVLSLQSHHHRSEHWVVVAGTAEVTVGDAVQLITENESIYIPLGTVHRMANPGKLPMYLVEVQTGAYLGEDDILRYDDIYNRD